MCPYGEALIDIPLGDLNHDGEVDDKAVKTDFRPRYGMTENLKGYVTKSRAHRYAECSNTGICNRNTGECQCFTGYEGSACQRRQCPSKVAGEICSGHGICISSTAYAKEQGSSYYGWELDKFFMCKCDEGYEGADCSLRQCPYGFDPVLYSGTTMKYVIDDGRLSKLGSTIEFYFQISYKGTIYNTPVIFPLDKKAMCPGGNKDMSVLAMYQEEIKTALQSTFPLSQSRVIISCGVDNSNATEGKLQQMEIIVDAIDPRYFQESTIIAIQSDDTPISDFTKVNGQILSKDGTAMLRDNSNSPTICSSRGMCDTTTGLCNCFQGYYGYSCETRLTVQG